ncbi:hypothetical protein T492DRAFT_1012948 [Pavlovales sp. CCMP2436]|nr:hypothetical protein T492DRAFT_1012948 [Pavlovales sp. CCMP2436]|eukprot:CAMPEP_0179858142 /NCGR_PEP_ID=MMETSP0982-20121206/12188_1 /TAXON_ID=483367 /ORGANISM="non described non described, Strain CCMP 2436" /LENGTH=182 /DNA_ID=CAMNT_0021744833 /DNA_START=250 /DNA_END=798 /DNA_ORIENTATION=-
MARIRGAAARCDSQSLSLHVAATSLRSAEKGPKCTVGAEGRPSWSSYWPELVGVVERGVAEDLVGELSRDCLESAPDVLVPEVEAACMLGVLLLVGGRECGLFSARDPAKHNPPRPTQLLQVCGQCAQSRLEDGCQQLHKGSRPRLWLGLGLGLDLAGVSAEGAVAPDGCADEEGSEGRQAH